MRALDRALCRETEHHSDVVPMIAIHVLVFRLGMSLILTMTFISYRGD